MAALPLPKCKVALVSTQSPTGFRFPSMNHRPAGSSLLFLHALALLLLVSSAVSFLKADDYWSSRGSSSSSRNSYSSKGPVLRQYTLDDRIRYQLWDYTWKPDPDEPITKIVISIGQQRVYVYQDGRLAGESPITTGKPGYDTPPGHYTILVKDIDHKSSLYGDFIDPTSGTVIDGNAKVGEKPPPGAVYDSADMPYYMRLRDDGVGLHGGYIPGKGPASHGCIRLPHAFAELLYSNVSVGTPVDVNP
jgi:lipoprotein-anchoring transpeptidase ErfK/SrfK